MRKHDVLYFVKKELNPLIRIILFNYKMGYIDDDLPQSHMDTFCWTTWLVDLYQQPWADWRVLYNSPR